MLLLLLNMDGGLARVADNDWEKNNFARSIMCHQTRKRAPPVGAPLNRSFFIRSQSSPTFSFPRTPGTFWIMDEQVVERYFLQLALSLGGRNGGCTCDI